MNMWKEYLSQNQGLAGSSSSSSSACGSVDRYCAATANRCGKNIESTANLYRSRGPVELRILNTVRLLDKGRFGPARKYYEQYVVVSTIYCNDIDLPNKSISNKVKLSF